MEGAWQNMPGSFVSAGPMRDDETYEEWVERSDKLEKKAEIRMVERNKKRAKARAKRKRTGR